MLANNAKEQRKSSFKSLHQKYAIAFHCQSFIWHIVRMWSELQFHSIFILNTLASFSLLPLPVNLFIPSSNASYCIFVAVYSAGIVNSFTSNSPAEGCWSVASVKRKTLRISFPAQLNRVYSRSFTRLLRFLILEQKIYIVALRVSIKGPSSVGYCCQNVVEVEGGDCWERCSRTEYCVEDGWNGTFQLRNNWQLEPSVLSVILDFK